MPKKTEQTIGEKIEALAAAWDEERQRIYDLHTDARQYDDEYRIKLNSNEEGEDDEELIDLEEDREQAINELATACGISHAISMDDLFEFAEAIVNKFIPPQSVRQPKSRRDSAQYNQENEK